MVSYYHYVVWSIQGIHYAAANGCVELLTSLIEHSGVNPQDRQAEVCIISCCVLYNHDLVQTNLQPLHYAATAGQLEIVKILIDVYKVPADIADMVIKWILFYFNFNIDHF